MTANSRAQKLATHASPRTEKRNKCCRPKVLTNCVLAASLAAALADVVPEANTEAIVSQSISAHFSTTSVLDLQVVLDDTINLPDRHPHH